MTVQTSNSTRRYEILTGLVILGLTFGIFLVGEIGLRLTQFLKFGVQDSVETSKAFYVDEKSGLRLIYPNKQLGQVRINNLGFRGPDVSVEKPKDVIRLLFLGSSTTYDASASELNNWPHKTATLLAQFFSECDFDFVNAGQPGFSTRRMLKLYATKLARLDVDIALILPGDINQDLDWLTDLQGFDDVHYHSSVLAKFSVLWAKLEKNFRIIKLQRNAFSRVGKVKLDLPILQERFRQRLYNLTNKLIIDGITVFVVTIGSQLQAEQKPEQQIRAANTNLFYMPHIALQDLIATRDGYNAVIEELSFNQNLDILYSTNVPPSDRIHYSDTMHFTPKGSAVMADALHKELLSHRTFREHLKNRGCLP